MAPKVTAFAPSGWSITQDSTANTIQTLTKAAVTGKTHYIMGVFVFTGAATVGAADVTALLKDGTTVVWKGIIGAGDAQGACIGFTVSVPIAMTAGNAVNLVVSAGGASVVTTANIIGYTI
jgi:hypothetical protein